MHSVSPQHFDPRQIQWEAVHDDGTKSSTLVGSRDAGQMFTYAFFIPAGVFDAPHHHAADAHLHVAVGSLSLGYGDAFDVDAVVSYPAGSFLFVPARTAHFDGALEDTVIIGTATGPWDTVYL